MKTSRMRDKWSGVLWRMLGVFATVSFPLWLSAQELDCKVAVNHSQVQGTNVQVFKTFETALTEFINERHWTQAQYEVNERIRCSMNFTVKSYDCLLYTSPSPRDCS